MTGDEDVARTIPTAQPMTAVIKADLVVDPGPWGITRTVVSPRRGARTCRAEVQVSPHSDSPTPDHATSRPATISVEHYSRGR